MYFYLVEDGFAERLVVAKDEVDAIKCVANEDNAPVGDYKATKLDPNKYEKTKIVKSF